MSADPEGIAARASAVLAASSAAAVVLDIPSDRIIAASDTARLLLAGSEGPSVIGRGFEEFTADGPSGGVELFARGRLTGFETTRSLRGADGAGLQVTAWLRAFEDQPPSRYALVVLVPTNVGRMGTMRSTGEDLTAVIGTADGSLLIERISGEAEDLFGIPVEQILGRSLIGLVSQHDIPSWLGAFGESATTQRGVTLSLEVIRQATNEQRDGERLRCNALILPTQPAPSCVFALLPMRENGRDREAFDHVHSMLGRLARTTELARNAPSGMTEANVAGLRHLTSRELDIATRLLGGDRVSAIASDLFLAQSTIRNHLARIYRKLGVSSQQALIALLRDAHGHA
jgi:DNA-binding CsgD family transcriptional regulator